MKRDREKPGPGQESVWDYPRPPKLERCEATIRIVSEGKEIAATTKAFRVLETSHPPVFYLPPEDVEMRSLRPNSLQTFCEWKGIASYFDLELADGLMPQVAWHYKNPSARFSQIKDYLAFYPTKVDACFVNDERVVAQEGDFYGGWITSKIVGPFKGGPGTRGW